MIFAIMSPLISFAGIACLYLSWRSKTGKTAMLTSGWLLLLGSIYPWSRIMGSEFGLVFSLSIPGLMACLLIALNSPSPSVNSKPILLPGKKMVVNLDHNDLARFLFVIPLCSLSSLVCSLATAIYLPLVRADQMALAIVLLPVLGAVFISWVLMAARPGKTALVISIMTILSAVLVYSR